MMYRFLSKIEEHLPHPVKMFVRANPLTRDIKIIAFLFLPVVIGIWLLSIGVRGLIGLANDMPQPVGIVISISFYMILVFFVIWLLYFLYRRILLIFGIKLVEDDLDTLYHQILDIVYSAIDNEIVNKVGLYFPSSPNNLRPVSYDMFEVNGMNMFNVVFSKHKHMELIDIGLFVKLLERNMKRLRKTNKLPLAFADPVLYRGKQYEPLLFMNATQDTDNVTITLALAEEASIDMFIRSQESNKQKGALYDEA